MSEKLLMDDGDKAWIEGVTQGQWSRLLSIGRAQRILNSIEELEAALKSGCEDMANEMPARICGLAEKLQQRLEAVEGAVRQHIPDLLRTADVLEEWQDPNVGPFDATIAEIRKAAKELETALEKGDE